jgi:hypothetical protein
MFNWEPEIDLGAIQDSLVNSCTGWSFLSELANGLQHSFRHLQQRAWHDKPNGLMAKQHWVPSRVARYLQQVFAFQQQLLLCMHFTGGMPGIVIIAVVAPQYRSERPAPEAAARSAYTGPSIRCVYISIPALPRLIHHPQYPPVYLPICLPACLPACRPARRPAYASAHWLTDTGASTGTGAGTGTSTGMVHRSIAQAQNSYVNTTCTHDIELIQPPLS